MRIILAVLLLVGCSATTVVQAGGDALTTREKSFPPSPVVEFHRVEAPMERDDSDTEWWRSLRKVPVRVGVWYLTPIWTATDELPPSPNMEQYAPAGIEGYWLQTRRGPDGHWQFCYMRGTPFA